MKAFKVKLKLKEGVKPHLTLKELKEGIEKDGYLHPLMENSLKVMKKSRMPYLPLAHVKEVIFVPEKFLHLEAGIEPQHTGFAKIEWCEEEIKEYKEDPDKYFKGIFNLYKSLGYNIVKDSEVDEEQVEFLIKNTGKKKRKKSIFRK